MLKSQRGLAARSLQPIGQRVRRRRFALGSFALLGLGSGLLVASPGASAWRLSRQAEALVEPADEVVEAPVPAIFDESATSAEIAEMHLQPSDDPNLRWFNGRPIRAARTMTMLVTAYSPDARSCGKWADGITASGYSVFTNGMKLAAADLRVLPFGSLVSVPGYDGGQAVPVLDKGGKIKGRRLDVLFPTHEAARRWGTRRLAVTIWEYADGQASGFKQRHRRS